MEATRRSVPLGLALLGLVAVLATNTLSGPVQAQDAPPIDWRMKCCWFDSDPSVNDTGSSQQDFWLVPNPDDPEAEVPNLVPALQGEAAPQGATSIDAQAVQWSAEAGIGEAAVHIRPPADTWIHYDSGVVISRRKEGWRHVVPSGMSTTQCYWHDPQSDECAMLRQHPGLGHPWSKSRAQALLALSTGFEDSTPFGEDPEVYAVCVSYTRIQVKGMPGIADDSRYVMGTLIREGPTWSVGHTINIAGGLGMSPAGLTGAATLGYGRSSAKRQGPPRATYLPIPEAVGFAEKVSYTYDEWSLDVITQARILVRARNYEVWASADAEYDSGYTLTMEDDCHDLHPQ